MELFLSILAFGLIGFFAAFAASFEAGLAFIGIFFVSLFVLGWVLTFMAKRHLITVVPMPINAVAEAVRNQFHGVGWREVPGNGHFNFQSRGIGLNSYGMENPVLSIDLEDLDDGTTGIEVWMSEWMSRYGIASSCDRVISKRWRLTRKLATLGQTAGLAN